MVCDEIFSLITGLSTTGAWPVVLLTAARKVLVNLMTMSWHTMVKFTPPLVACTVSCADYSFAALRSTKKCVISISSHKLIRKVAGAGTVLNER